MSIAPIAPIIILIDYDTKPPASYHVVGSVKIANSNDVDQIIMTIICNSATLSLYG